MTVTELDRPTGPLTPFTARVTAEGTSTVLTLQGEVDVLTLPEVVDVLARVIAEHDGPVVVDFADISFIDGRTVSALGRAAQLLAGRDRTLTVRGASPMALRLLTLLGLSDVIQIGPPQDELRLDLPSDSVDRRDAPTSTDAVATTLDLVAGDLRSLWSTAITREDFTEVTRIVDASHAVHRAVIALRADIVIAARHRSSGRAVRGEQGV